MWEGEKGCEENINSKKGGRRKVGWVASRGRKEKKKSEIRTGGGKEKTLTNIVPSLHIRKAG